MNISKKQLKKLIDAGIERRLGTSARQGESRVNELLGVDDGTTEPGGFHAASEASKVAVANRREEEARSFVSGMDQARLDDCFAVSRLAKQFKLDPRDAAGLINDERSRRG